VTPFSGNEPSIVATDSGKDSRCKKLEALEEVKNNKDKLFDYLSREQHLKEPKIIISTMPKVESTSQPLILTSKQLVTHGSASNDEEIPDEYAPVLQFGHFDEFEHCDESIPDEIINTDEDESSGLERAASEFQISKLKQL